LAAVDVVGRATGLEPLEPLEDARARELFERHAERVLAYCRSRLHRPEDAEDAVQTTFLHAMRNLRRGEEPLHELAWLLGIARNVCLARIETAGRRGRLELVVDPVDLERSEAPAGRREELIGLEDALARLPERQRRAVLLRDWRGLSYHEVAAELGVSHANAETLIFRGRAALAAELREQPSTVRRRLAALGNGGSLLAWLKGALGGAAGAKAAAAVAVVAVSGAGIAAGTGVLATGPRAQPPATPTAAVTPRSAPAPAAAPNSASDTLSQAVPARADAATAQPRSTPERAAKRPAAAPAPSSGPAPTAESASDTVSQAPSGGANPGTAPEHGSAPRAAPAVPEPRAAVTTATDVVAETAERATGAVERVVPAIAPATEAIAEAVAGAVAAVPVPALPVEPPPAVEKTVDAAVEKVGEAVRPLPAAPPLLP
jgi:RNA polymerase sigma factor (sigma-70 family)